MDSRRSEENIENSQCVKRNGPTRRNAIRAFGLLLLNPLSACGKAGKAMEAETNIAVVMYSYLDRSIFDIFFNRTDLGAAGPCGSTGIVTGVRLPFGAQSLSWRLDGPEGMARNGDTVKLKNGLIVTANDISAGVNYLGLHLYPDETAEITFSASFPERTHRETKV